MSAVPLRLALAAALIAALPGCNLMRGPSADAREPVGAAAQMTTTLIDARNVEAIMRVLRGFGDIERGLADDGTPRLDGRMGNYRYAVYFYGCDDGNANCTNVMFASGFDADHSGLEAMQAWNFDSRFSRVYLADDGDPIIEMDVNLEHGVTKRNFEATVGVWRDVLLDFGDFLYRDAPADSSGRAEGAQDA